MIEELKFNKLMSDVNDLAEHFFTFGSKWMGMTESIENDASESQKKEMDKVISNLETAMESINGEA